MGGGRKFPYPKYVWSPYGGWWPTPKHWQRNTAILFSVTTLMSYFVYQFGEKNTKHYVRKEPEHQFVPVRHRSSHGHGDHDEHDDHHH